MKNLFTTVVVLLSFTAFGQQVRVTDAENNQPVAGALLYTTDGKIATYTDGKGYADITAFTGADKVYIRQLGYKLEAIAFSELLTNSTVKLQSGGLTAEEVVISANKWEQQRREFSGHSAIVSRKEVELQNPQTAADLLALSGSVFVQKSQLGGGSPMLRGFATNRVLLVVDGVRMNTSIFRAGNVQNALRLDANNIETAEIIFGPGSLIYGSDAIGGVMDYHTFSPRLSNTGKVQVTGNGLARFASANFEKTGHLDFNIGAKKVAFLTSFTFSDYDDLRMGSNGAFDSYLRNAYQQTYVQRDSLGEKQVIDTFYRNQNNLVQKGSGFQQWNFMQKVRFQPNEYNRLTAAFHISRSSNVPRYDRLTEFTGAGLPSYSEWYYGPEQWLMGHVEYLYSKPNAAFNEVKVNVAYQQNKESRNDRRYQSRWLRRQQETVHGISANVDFNKNWNNKYFLFYGVEVVTNINKSFADRLDVFNDTTQKFTQRYPNSTWQSYAAYIAGRAKFGEKVIFNAGLRYNHFLIHSKFDTSTIAWLPFDKADLNFGAVTGSVGATFLPTSTWRIFVNFSTGFRAPNIDDVGKVFESAPGILVVPNKDLKSEYSLNGEIGIEKRFGKVATLYVGGYYNYLLNALTNAPFQINGSDSLYFNGQNNAVRAIQNSSYVYVWGIQATAKFDFGKGFGAFISYNYQYGREQIEINGVDSLYPMRHVVPMFGTVHLTYKRSRWAVDVYCNYSGQISPKNLAVQTLENPSLFPRNDLGEFYSPAWYTLNVKGSFDITQYLTAVAGIENLTDNRYRTYSSGISAPGINFIVGLRGRF